MILTREPSQVKSHHNPRPTRNTKDELQAIQAMKLDSHLLIEDVLVHRLIKFKFMKRNFSAMFLVVSKNFAT